MPKVRVPRRLCRLRDTQFSTKVACCWGRKCDIQIGKLLSSTNPRAKQCSILGIRSFPFRLTPTDALMKSRCASWSSSLTLLAVYIFTCSDNEYPVKYKICSFQKYKICCNGCFRCKNGSATCHIKCNKMSDASLLQEKNTFHSSEQTSEVVQVPKCRTFCAPQVPLSSEGQEVEPWTKHQRHYHQFAFMNKRVIKQAELSSKYTAFHLPSAVCDSVVSSSK